MNKAQFVEKLAKSLNLPKSQSETVLEKTLSLITQSLSQGDDIKFVGFGTFDISHRKAKKGRNPKTGETLTIPAANVPRFRPGKEFKEIIAKKAKKSIPKR